jgi:rubrerythrin
MENFNVIEITRIAIDMEKEGQEFYRKASALAADEKLRSMFILLAEQEKKHSEIFYDLHKAFSEIGKLEDDYLYDEEVALYIKALVDNKVFRQEELERIKKMDSMKDALQIGINSEMNSILFYSEMIRNTKSAEVMGALSLILAEEKKHLVDLTNLINTI